MALHSVTLDENGRVAVMFDEHHGLASMSVEEFHDQFGKDDQDAENRVLLTSVSKELKQAGTISPGVRQIKVEKSVVEGK